MSNVTVSISPSLLESFRRCVSDPEMSGDKLEAEILAPRETTPAMSRGTAFHRMIEEGSRKFALPGPDNSELFAVPEDELNTVWYFTPADAEKAEACRNKYQNGIHELKRKLEFEIDGVKVEMSLRIDCLEMLTIAEFKTTGKPKKWIDYFDSLQWRCYCVAYPEVLTVEYTVFVFNSKDVISQVQFFQYYPTTVESAEVELWLSRFLQWAKERPAVWQHLIDRASR